MVIEVKDSVIGEIMARTSKKKIKKESLNQAEKLTSEGQRLLIHPVKTRTDGKQKYVGAWDRSNKAENGLCPARSYTDSHPMSNRRNIWV